MISVYLHLNIKTCCFGASRLDDAKLNYLREQRDSGSSTDFHFRLKNSTS